MAPYVRRRTEFSATEADICPYVGVVRRDSFSGRSKHEQFKKYFQTDNSVMIRLLILVLTILLALASAGGYLFLTQKIVAGERAIAEGQNTIAKASPSLEEGKTDLAEGKQKLAEGKKEYEQAHDNALLVLADKLFNAGKGFAEGRKKIAEGEKKVAQGEDKVSVGEERLEKGSSELRLGMEKLQLGKEARDICALGAIVFTSLSVVLGFIWRKSLARFFKRTKAKSG